MFLTRKRWTVRAYGSDRTKRFSTAWKAIAYARSISTTIAKPTNKNETTFEIIGPFRSKYGKEFIPCIVMIRGKITSTSDHESYSIRWSKDAGTPATVVCFTQVTIKGGKLWFPDRHYDPTAAQYSVISREHRKFVQKAIRAAISIRPVVNQHDCNGAMMIGPRGLSVASKHIGLYPELGAEFLECIRGIAWKDRMWGYSDYAIVVQPRGAIKIVCHSVRYCTSHFSILAHFTDVVEEVGASGCTKISFDEVIHSSNTMFQDRSIMCGLDDLRAALRRKSTDYTKECLKMISVLELFREMGEKIYITVSHSDVNNCGLVKFYVDSEELVTLAKVCV